MYIRPSNSSLCSVFVLNISVCIYTYNMCINYIYICMYIYIYILSSFWFTVLSLAVSNPLLNPFLVLVIRFSRAGFLLNFFLVS